MVERYLMKKSLMRPLQGIAELKRIKALDNGKDGMTQTQIKELKSYFVGFEQLFVPQISGSSQSKGTSMSRQSMAPSTKGSSVANDTPKVVIKEVCCCQKGGKGA